MTIKLRTQSVVADAPQELCFEVVAAAGRKVEEISPTERLVEFKTSYRGHEVVTLERLVLHRPARIDYEWVEGPLPYVRESIAFVPNSGGRTSIVYEGEFEVAGGLVARLIARLWIKSRFERIVLEHLEDAKRIAEQRSERSHVHRRAHNASDIEPRETGGST